MQIAWAGSFSRSGFGVSGGFAFLFASRFGFGLFAQDCGVRQQGGVFPFASFIQSGYDVVKIVHVFQQNFLIDASTVRAFP